ncbi:hypothetical protein [Marimonas arenosa]|uniref:Uncharacterized protein n=1 Tax=Marimonas arenosa TaxID=1795305 RepID=A0AAE4B689_9RHOB|nr:hypothetical protein [Marimonas arenosa]MDQ2092120.1 hypothetical protein [Marimonas arenosa]
MKNDWILDVLTDLKAFAKANGLVALAEQLEDASLVAAAEIASDGEGSRVDAEPAKGTVGKDPSGVRTRL